jgi:sugar phosphate isomerase/epimerase
MGTNMALKIGIFVDGFRRPVAEGLKLAAEMGVACFQVYVTAGEMLAANMGKPARKEFVKRYRGLGLELSATCGDFGMNFGDVAGMRKKEPLLREAIVQTVDLGASIMTTHIGSVAEDKAREEAMVAALKRIGDYAASQGVTLATETGPEPGSRLRAILDRAGTKGLAVNFDPANLVMRGFDPMQAARDLAAYIVHTHAKDGRRVGGKGQETPLGEGEVNFPAYVQLMTELGYHGAYVIEREVGADPVADIRKAVAYLKGL